MARDKPIDWRGTSFEDLSAFPEDARKKGGRDLRKVQRGLMPSDWKPFHDIGRGTCEIRIACADGVFRIMYVAKFAEAVYVLHCFQKKGRKTSEHDKLVAKERYRNVIAERSQQK